MKLFIIHEAIDKNVLFPHGEPVIICNSAKSANKWFYNQEVYKCVRVTIVYLNKKIEWGSSELTHYCLSKDHDTYNDFEQFMNSQFVNKCIKEPEWPSPFSF